MIEVGGSREQRGPPKTPGNGSSPISTQPTLEDSSSWASWRVGRRPLVAKMVRRRRCAVGVAAAGAGHLHHGPAVTAIAGSGRCPAVGVASCCSVDGVAARLWPLRCGLHFSLIPGGFRLVLGQPVAGRQAEAPSVRFRAANNSTHTSTAGVILAAGCTALLLLNESHHTPTRRR